MFIKHRLLKNKPRGNWSLEFDPIASQNAIKGRLTFNAKTVKILLMSDEFHALFDKYLNINPKEIIPFIEFHGINQCYTMLRDLENNDETCMTYPRLKKSDDATLVLLTLSEDI